MSHADDHRRADIPPRRRGPFQFGLRGLLVLTTVCAVVAFLVRLLFGPTFFGVLMFWYFGLLALYAVLRASHILGRFRPQWRELRQRRQRLAEEVARSKTTNGG
jgi:hypothetical protein